MTTIAAMTSDEIAGKAELSERYVREWLGAMVCSGIVEVDPEAGTYRLPDEHAGLLTRASANNLGIAAQLITLVSGVEDDVVQCFRSGGGVPYARNRRTTKSAAGSLRRHLLQ
ncbi:MAG: hypothetical protein R3D27_09765 [Hyphomicrobiaceae bacterium]